MADPASGADAHPIVAHRRNERRRRRIRRMIAASSPAVALSSAFVARRHRRRALRRRRQALARRHRAGGTGRARPRPRRPTTIGAATCRPLTVQRPLRLWVGGDSLAGSLGPSLGTIAGATGVVQPYFDSRVSSGLSDPGFFDWPDHATTEMARLDPEVVVFIIGTNDWTAVPRRLEGRLHAEGRLDDEDVDRPGSHRVLARRADAEGRDRWTPASCR